MLCFLGFLRGGILRQGVRQHNPMIPLSSVSEALSGSIDRCSDPYSDVYKQIAG